MTLRAYSPGPSVRCRGGAGAREGGARDRVSLIEARTGRGRAGARARLVGGADMQLRPGFTFTPLPDAPIGLEQTYGPLWLLPGHWAGTGFNLITRPFHDPAGKQNHFLELNLTNETIDFALIEGAIPNRGLLQDDIKMYGVTY